MCIDNTIAPHVTVRNLVGGSCNQAQFVGNANLLPHQSRISVPLNQKIDKKMKHPMVLTLLLNRGFFLVIRDAVDRRVTATKAHKQLY